MTPINPLDSHLLGALNAAAASLQQSLRSEADVLYAFRDQLDRLNLRGGLGLVDQSGSKLILRSVFQNPHTQKLLRRLETFLGFTSEGYEVDIDQVEVYRQVVQDQRAVFIANSNHVLIDYFSKRKNLAASRIMNRVGAFPGIFAPLISKGQVLGIVNLVGEGLSPDDMPAVQAFANHIAIALENARLFAAMNAALERAVASENRVLQLNQRLEATLNAIPDWMMEIDSQGLIIAFHRPHTGTEHRPSEYVGKTLADLAPEDKLPEIQAAIETADVVLMTDSPSKMAEAVSIAKQTRNIVWQNISLAFVIKGIFIVLGAMGLASMWEAVFADVGVALLAILNATRIQKMSFSSIDVK